MLKVVIIGYGEMFTNLIAASLDAQCEIVGVVRNASIKYNPIIKKVLDIFNPSIEYNYIKSYNLPEITTRSVNSEDFRKQLIKLNPDIILVGSWGEKFEKKTFDIPKIATINAHPSLLPKYRGPNPYYWVIKNREKTSGITFHLMDESFDTGSILAQEEIEINSDETGESLKRKTVLKARGVACELLKTLQEDVIIPLQQSENKSSYYSHPEYSELDFGKSAEENYALIRASHPWVKAYFYHNVTPLIPNPHKTSITENFTNQTTAGTIIDVNIKAKEISVLCSDGKVLKMSDINHYKKYDRPFTKFYIEREVKIGDNLQTKDY